MRKDVSKKFIKDIDYNAKLYEVINVGGEKMYTIEEEMDGEYVEIFSCVATEEEPERMIKTYLRIGSIKGFIGL